MQTDKVTYREAAPERSPHWDEIPGSEILVIMAIGAIVYLTVESFLRWIFIKL